jgi:hypothetical protein
VDLEDAEAMRDFTAKLDIPLYYSTFSMGVGATAPMALVALRKKYGFTYKSEDNDFSGLTISKGSDYAIALGHDRLEHDVIAHEIFHATQAIMERCCEPIDPDHHEPHAYLCGLLTAWVYQQIKKRGGRVR